MEAATGEELRDNTAKKDKKERKRSRERTPPRDSSSRRGDRDRDGRDRRRRSSSRDRSPDRRRDRRHRSHSGDRRRRSRSTDRRRRSRSPDRHRRSRSPEPREEKEKPGVSTASPTLTDIMRQNPGVSLGDCMSKLAVAKQQHAALMMQQQMASQMLQQQPSSDGSGGLGGVPGGLGAAPMLPGLPGLPPPGGMPLNPALWAQAQPAMAEPKELYCANLPPGLEAPHLTEFLGAAFLALLPKGEAAAAAAAGHPFTACHLSEDGATAFLEVRSSQEAERCVAALDAILLDDHELKIGALAKPEPPPEPTPPPVDALAAAGLPPTSAQPPPPPAMPADPLAAAQAAAQAAVARLNLPGAAPASAPAAATTPAPPPPTPTSTSPFLMCMDAPDYLEESLIRKLLDPFGDLKQFCLLKDSAGKSRGTFLFSYADPEVTSGALAALQGLELGEHTTLSFQRIAPPMAKALFDEGGDEGAAAAAEEEGGEVRPGGGAAATAAIEAGAEAGLAKASGDMAAAAAAAAGAATDAPEQPPPAAVAGTGLESSTVLRLDSMVGEADLASATDVAEIEEDVREESARFGTVVSVLVPPLGAPGCGAVFVEFETEDAATRARRVMDNRAFGDGKVRAMFFDSSLYHTGDLGEPLFSAPPQAAPPPAPIPASTPKASVPSKPAPAVWSGVAMEDEEEENEEAEVEETPAPPQVDADDLD